MDGRREDVVGGLGGIYLVIGVDAPAQALRGQGRQDLVHVHIGRGARPGLENVDRELGVPAPFGYLEGSFGDGGGDIGRHHAEVGVFQGRRPFHQGEPAYERPLDALAGDREVLDGALGLRLPLGAAPAP